MSDLEAQIDNALKTFEADVNTVRQKLEPLLNATNIDALSAAEPSKRAAVPYALSAYALSSMLFAYLRSEGKDTALVMPELSRVKTKMEKVNQMIQGGSEETAVSADQESSEPKEESSAEITPTGVHTRFEEKPAKVKKNKKSIARAKKEREAKKAKKL